MWKKLRVNPFAFLNGILQKKYCLHVNYTHTNGMLLENALERKTSCALVLMKGFTSKSIRSALRL